MKTSRFSEAPRAFVPRPAEEDTATMQLSGEV